MQDHQIPNAKLPSPTELFTDEAFEPGKEIAEFGNNNNPKVQGLHDGLSSSSSQQNNKINSLEVEDELDKYLGKKSSGISSYTRKNSVDSGSGSHGSGTGSHSGISECENNTKPQHQLINKEDTINNAPVSPQTQNQPSWKLTFCLKKVQKTNYSQVAANIREENNKNISTTNQNKSDSPPLDPRKSHHSGNGSKDSATGCSTWMTADDEDVELNLHLSDDEEMDDEFQEPIAEDNSSIQQPDRLSDEQRDFSEKGLTTSEL